MKRIKKNLLTASYEKTSNKNDVTTQVIPTNRLITIRNMYAVLGSLKRNETGYITGVMDHLWKKEKVKILKSKVKDIYI